MKQYMEKPGEEHVRLMGSVMGTADEVRTAYEKMNAVLGTYTDIRRDVQMPNGEHLMYRIEVPNGEHQDAILKSLREALQ